MMGDFPKVLSFNWFVCKVEPPITAHLRDNALDLEKYKAVWNFRM